MFPRNATAAWQQEGNDPGEILRSSTQRTTGAYLDQVNNVGDDRLHVINSSGYLGAEACKEVYDLACTVANTSHHVDKEHNLVTQHVLQAHGTRDANLGAKQLHELRQVDDSLLNVLSYLFVRCDKVTGIPCSLPRGKHRGPHK